MTSLEWLPARVRERLVPIDSGCWQWSGTTNGNGYGEVTFGRKEKWLVHRYVYTQLRGAIPAGLVIDHLCRNRRCANPAHLEPVTNAENLRRGDSSLVVRRLAAAARQRTHCKRGHELAGANLRRGVVGRQCRACANQLEAGRKRRRRREAAARVMEAH